MLNALCGEKVAITSPVPQTTRNSIRGIINHPEGQVIFLDTPGYHQSDRKFNLFLQDIVHKSLKDSDLVLYVIDASRAFGQEEEILMKLLENNRNPVIVAINKIDASPPRISELRGFVIAHLKPAAIINVSALKGMNLKELTEAIVEACPDGEIHYPKDVYTDQNTEFRISELIREQAIARCRQELPHALYVEIADLEFADNKSLWVRAFLIVDKPTQAGILVGHNGERIREIRIAAQREMKKIFSWKIHLDLRVKVHPKWRKKESLLKRMSSGY